MPVRFSEFLTTPTGMLVAALRRLGLFAEGVKPHFQRCFLTFGDADKVDAKLAGVKEDCRFLAVFIFPEEKDEARLRDAGFFEYEAVSDERDRGPVFFPVFKAGREPV